MSGAGPSLYPGELPSWSVFKFPPDPAPAAIPPPFEEPSFKTPFPISAETYNAALSFKVPLTIASIYATTVFFLNWYNRSHGNKPWAISKTSIFKIFVLLHNIGLAIYSAVTCVAMVRALKYSIPHYTEHNAVVGTIDALCKMHGPRGLGDAATWNTDRSSWEIKNSFIHLGANGLPDSTDVGRIWNEGLAFWGWFFYLSKFYEVLDTAIIIAKGKRSTTLQTYHHAGAMLCMWAGIRYMSPPIWMFVLVNSGIHAMMVRQSLLIPIFTNVSQYTYYTLSALGVRVPQAVKRTLTSLQILQFIVGATFAGLHLFVSYTVPVSIPYRVTEAVTAAPSSVSSIAASIASPTALATATGAAVAFLKKLVYRAAGEEGLAENIPFVGDSAYTPQGLEVPLQQAFRNIAERVVYRTEYHHVPCIDTSGQAFAIYLNLIYLAPLTGLFVRFFVKSYIRRTSSSTKHITKKNAISKSSRDAIRGVDRELESLGKAAEDGVATGFTQVKNNVRGRTSGLANGKRAGSLSPENQKFVDSFNRKVSQRLEDIGEGDEATRQRAKKLAKEIVEQATSNASSRRSSVASSPTKSTSPRNDKDKSSTANGKA